jgi:hypothetical protein
MATAERIHQTREKLLNAIDEKLAKGPSSQQLFRLAEAFAWVVSPSQAHGASTIKRID